MPRWRWNKRTVTVTFDLDEAVHGIGDTLNEWKHWRGWVDREDCQNWKRSPIARENRRESIVYGNCLGIIQVVLGRDGVRQLMEMAESRRAEAATGGPDDA